MSIMDLSKNNGNWKGDNAGHSAIHLWIRKYLPQPDSCQECGKITTTLDLANISGVYNREFSSYKYLCRKCHFTFDRKVDASDRICNECGSNETYINSNGTPVWFRCNPTGWTCSKCRDKIRYKSKPIKIVDYSHMNVVSAVRES